MKIPDDVLDQAYKKFGAFHSRWLQNPDHIEKVVSFVVENSIDYEALALRLENEDFAAGHTIAASSEYLRLAHEYAATLGIGDTDE